MNQDDKDLARMGLRLALLEHRPMIRDLCLDKFKPLCMAAELSEMEEDGECYQDNGEDIAEILADTLPDAWFWACQMLFGHFSRLAGGTLERYEDPIG